MTVTNADAEVGRAGSPQAQAEQWARVIDNTLVEVRAIQQKWLLSEGIG